MYKMLNQYFEKFREKGLVGNYGGCEYINVFDPNFQAYLQHFKLNYPKQVYNDVIDNFNPAEIFPFPPPREF